MLFLLLPLNYPDSFVANFEQLLLGVGSGQIETEILKMFLDILRNKERFYWQYPSLNQVNSFRPCVTLVIL